MLYSEILQDNSGKFRQRYSVLIAEVYLIYFYMPLIFCNILDMFAKLFFNGLLKNINMHLEVCNIYLN